MAKPRMTANLSPRVVETTEKGSSSRHYMNDVPLTPSVQEREAAASILALSSSVSVTTRTLLANVFNPASTVRVRELPKASMGTCHKRKFKRKFVEEVLLDDRGAPSSAIPAFGGVQAPTPSLDFHRKFGPLLRAELGNEFLSYNLALLAITTPKSSLHLQVVVRVDALAETLYRTATVAFLNGSAMQPKFGVPFEASFLKKADCIAAAAATQEVVRLRAVLKFHNFPQLKATKLAAVRRMYLLLHPSNTTEHSDAFIRNRDILHGKITSGEVNFHEGRDCLFEEAFIARHLKASSVQVPPN
jgi:hypothetical protein